MYGGTNVRLGVNGNHGSAGSELTQTQIEMVILQLPAGNL